MRRVLQRAAALAALLVLVAARADARPFRVCTMAFHGPDELAVFTTHLRPPDFELVPIEPADRGTPSWLVRACAERRPRCDVVVLSGEFGGRFFGSYGWSLGLQELDEASCSAACDGLLHEPAEVFLLACNTLATKGEDQRTPHEYLHVLLDHGFDQAAAERVVQMRYGPVGPSFRESLRRVFAGVPRVYGFASVAPRAVHTTPMLERYFATTGDYAAYLERVGAAPERNARLAAAFARTSLVQATGLRADEPGARDRATICRLYDERVSVADRLRTAAALMARGQTLAYLPTIEVFLERHPAERYDAEEAAAFAGLREQAAARDDVLRLARGLEVSALKLEVAHFAVHMGWLDPADFQTLAVDAARALLARPLTSEIVDIECEIAKHAPLADAVRSEDIAGLAFQLAEGIRMVDCLAPKDPEVTTRLVGGLASEDPSTRAWAAYALSRRLPLPESALAALAARADDPSEEVRRRVQWIFSTQRDVPRGLRMRVATAPAGRAVD